jgi:hypothetical protein
MAARPVPIITISSLASSVQIPIFSVLRELVNLAAVSSPEH